MKRQRLSVRIYGWLYVDLFCLYKSIGISEKNMLEEIFNWGFGTPYLVKQIPENVLPVSASVSKKLILRHNVSMSFTIPAENKHLFSFNCRYYNVTMNDVMQRLIYAFCLFNQRRIADYTLKMTASDYTELYEKVTDRQRTFERNAKIMNDIKFVEKLGKMFKI